MEQKLNYLRKYNKNIRVLTRNEIDNLTSDIIPEFWCELFKENDINIRIKLLLGLWKKYLSYELRNTISYLNEYLEDIDIIEINNSYSILYTIKNSKGDYMYYEGPKPKEKFENEELEKVWDNTPLKLREFYENIHNGFYYYASESMGLVPLESVTYLGDDDLEWGIVDDLKEPLKINLESSFGFFSNGMGSYIAIDYLDYDDYNATFWSAKIKPKYDINFWSYVDEWIIIGFEE